MQKLPTHNHWSQAGERMRMNRDQEPADYHSIVLTQGGEEGYMHSAYEVIDIDALGQSHQYLKMKNPGTFGRLGNIYWAANCSITG